MRKVAPHARVRNGETGISLESIGGVTQLSASPSYRPGLGGAPQRPGFLYPEYGELTITLVELAQSLFSTFLDIHLQRGWAYERIKKNRRFTERKGWGRVSLWR